MQRKKTDSKLTEMKVAENKFTKWLIVKQVLR